MAGLPVDTSFDVEAYIANYTGHTRIIRLLYIADKFAPVSADRELAVLKLAADEVKKTDNAGLYKEVISRINGRLGPAYSAENGWLADAERRAAATQARLESDLSGYKSNLIKESIRLGHSDLGDFFYNTGDLQSAFKCYVRTRDYCTSGRHIASMCSAVIKTSIELGNWINVQNYVQKAEQAPDAMSDGVLSAQLKAANGLSLLAQRKYKQAARKFVEVGAEVGTSYSDVVSPADVAVYGGLCALASFDRPELKSRVLDNIGFREFLEAAPQVRELINAFYASSYGPALSLLETLLPTLALDIHLAPHAASLAEAIRVHALVQYVTPFSKVDLNKMAAAFGESVAALEQRLASLVVSGRVSARIDSAAKVLLARHADVRANTFQKVLSAGESYLRESKALLLRASLLQHDCVQRAGKRGGAGGAGGSGAGALLEPREPMIPMLRGPSAALG